MCTKVMKFESRHMKTYTPVAPARQAVLLHLFYDESVPLLPSCHTKAQNPGIYLYWKYGEWNM
jgi:hypothetical protein